MSDRSRWVDIGLFLALAVAISCLWYALILNTGAAQAGRFYILGLMGTPAIAALLTVRLRKLDRAVLGLGWAETRWNLAGYLIPLGYVAIAYVAIWLSGYGGFADPANVAAIAATLGSRAEGPALVLLGYFALMATTGFVTALTGGLGEEIGWRGFLMPRMMPMLGFTGTALVVGAIWAAWHLPLLILGNYNNGTEWWVGASCYTVLVLSISVILTWLRLRSNSVWPCAIFHASHNIFIMGFFTPITGARPGTPYAIGEFGVAVPAALALVAVWFWTKRGEVAKG